MSIGLVVRADQMAYLDQQFGRKFVGELRVALAKKYPQCLPSFPRTAQEQIVTNMLARAKRWEITGQHAQVAFAEMMLAIAPNFDDHAEFRAVFGARWLDPNRAMLSLDKRISRVAWKEMAASTQSLPLYLSGQHLEAPPLEQTSAAIALAVGDQLAGTLPDAQAVAARTLAEELGLDGVPDAGLVLAAWKLFYGLRFRDRAAFPWVDDVFDGGRAPREIIAMLKYRISLDHARYV